MPSLSGDTGPASRLTLLKRGERCAGRFPEESAMAEFKGEFGGVGIYAHFERSGDACEEMEYGLSRGPSLRLGRFSALVWHQRDVEVVSIPRPTR